MYTPPALSRDESLGSFLVFNKANGLLHHKSCLLSFWGKSGDPKKHKDVASSDSGPAESGGQACQPMGQHRQVRGLYRHSSTLPSWVAPLSQCLCQSFYLILSSGQALVGRNADFFFTMYLKSLVPKASLDTATDAVLQMITSCWRPQAQKGRSVWVYNLCSWAVWINFPSLVLFPVISAKY